MTTGDADRPADNGEQRPGAVDDEIWTELVAAFHASPSHQPGLWPDAEDLPRDPDGPEDDDADGADGVDGVDGAQPGAGPGPGQHRAPHSPDAGAGLAPGAAGHGDGHPGGPARVVRPAVRPGAAPAGPPAAVTWTGDAGTSISAGAGTGAPAHSHRATGSGGASGPGPRDWRTPEGVEEEGFVPPTPPPLELGVATKAAWLLGLGGPLYLALATLLHWETPQWASLLCILSGIAGFGYLVSRLKDRPDDDDDDPDDPTFGAVV